MLRAGGAVLIEFFVERGKCCGRILKPLIVTTLVAYTALELPFMLPALPPQQLLAYEESQWLKFLYNDTPSLLPCTQDLLCRRAE
jgi:hypothetical protein